MVKVKMVASLFHPHDSCSAERSLAFESTDYLLLAKTGHYLSYPLSARIMFAASSKFYDESRQQYGLSFVY